MQQKNIYKEFNLNPKKSYIIDVGGNDGVALKPFKDKILKIYLELSQQKT